MHRSHGTPRTSSVGDPWDKRNGRFVELQSIVLAHTSSSNLLPLVEAGTPRWKLPVCGVPIICYTLQLLEYYGFLDIIIVVHNDELGQIKDLLASSIYQRVDETNTILSVRTVPEYDMGEVQVLQHIQKDIHTDFMIVRGDLLTNANLRELAITHRKNDASLSLLLLNTDDKPQSPYARMRQKQHAEVKRKRRRIQQRKLREAASSRQSTQRLSQKQRRKQRTAAAAASKKKKAPGSPGLGTGTGNKPGVPMTKFSDSSYVKHFIGTDAQFERRANFVKDNFSTQRLLYLRCSADIEDKKISLRKRLLDARAQIQITSMLEITEVGIFSYWVLFFITQESHHMETLFDGVVPILVDSQFSLKPEDFDVGDDESEDGSVIAVTPHGSGVMSATGRLTDASLRLVDEASEPQLLRGGPGRSWTGAASYDSLYSDNGTAIESGIAPMSIPATAIRPMAIAGITPRAVGLDLSVRKLIRQSSVRHSPALSSLKGSPGGNATTATTTPPGSRTPVFVSKGIGKSPGLAPTSPMFRSASRRSDSSSSPPFRASASAGACSSRRFATPFFLSSSLAITGSEYLTFSSGGWQPGVAFMKPPSHMTRTQSTDAGGTAAMLDTSKNPAAFTASSYDLMASGLLTPGVGSEMPIEAFYGGGLQMALSPSQADDSSEAGVGAKTPGVLSDVCGSPLEMETDEEMMPSSKATSGARFMYPISTSSTGTGAAVSSGNGVVGHLPMSSAACIALEDLDSHSSSAGGGAVFAPPLLEDLLEPLSRSGSASSFSELASHSHRREAVAMERVTAQMRRLPFGATLGHTSSFSSVGSGGSMGAGLGLPAATSGRRGIGRMEDAGECEDESHTEVSTHLIESGYDEDSALVYVKKVASKTAASVILDCVPEFDPTRGAPNALDACIMRNSQESEIRVFGYTVQFHPNLTTDANSGGFESGDVFGSDGAMLGDANAASYVYVLSNIKNLDSYLTATTQLMSFMTRQLSLKQRYEEGTLDIGSECIWEERMYLLQSATAPRPLWANMFRGYKGAMAARKDNPTSKFTGDCLFGKDFESGEKCRFKTVGTGAFVRIGDNCELINCSIMGHVTIGNNCKMKNVVICENACVGNEVTLSGVLVGVNVRVPDGVFKKNHVIQTFDVGSARLDASPGGNDDMARGIDLRTL